MSHSPEAKRILSAPSIDELVDPLKADSCHSKPVTFKVEGIQEPLFVCVHEVRRERSQDGSVERHFVGHTGNPFHEIEGAFNHQNNTGWIEIYNFSRQ